MLKIIFLKINILIWKYYTIPLSGTERIHRESLKGENTGKEGQWKQTWPKRFSFLGKGSVTLEFRGFIILCLNEKAST